LLTGKEIAFFLKSEKHELKAYDMLGMQYYHMNDMDKAKYYHTRAMSGQVEPNSSPLKEMGMRKF
jgi:hypothetical protein